MKNNNFTIENCQCLDNKCSFSLQWWIFSLKDKLISQQNPPIQASNTAKNVDELIKAKNDLNIAIQDKILIENQPKYISPTIITNTKNTKEAFKANKNVKNKNKIAKILESTIFQDNDDDNNNHKNNKINIFNMIKINYIQQTSLLNTLFIMALLVMIIMNNTNN